MSIKITLDGRRLPPDTKIDSYHTSKFLPELVSRRLPGDPLCYVFIGDECRHAPDVQYEASPGHIDMQVSGGDLVTGDELAWVKKIVRRP